MSKRVVKQGTALPPGKLPLITEKDPAYQRARRDLTRILKGEPRALGEFLVSEAARLTAEVRLLDRFLESDRDLGTLLKAEAVKATVLKNLRAILQQLIDLSHSPENPGALEARLLRAAEKADLWATPVRDTKQPSS